MLLKLRECTEAAFQSLKGICKVEQGYIASINEHSGLSEAIIVHFDPETISLKRLIEVRLHTHQSTSDHSFRDKYRSAVYYFNEHQKTKVSLSINQIKESFDQEIITKVLPFTSFKPSRESIQNYYQKNPEALFCKRYIHPKLAKIKKEFGAI